jgi:hypothetical protein
MRVCAGRLCRPCFLARALLAYPCRRIMYGMPVDISDILKQGQRYVKKRGRYPQKTLKIHQDGLAVCFGYHVRLEISRDISWAESWLIWV